MNKLNFNSLKEFAVPENWIKNALNIPTEQERKKKTNFLRVRRVVTWAACLALVGIICVPVYIFESYEISVPSATHLQTETGESSSDLLNQSSQTLCSSEYTDPTERVTGFANNTDETDPTETPTSSYTDSSEPVKVTDSKEEDPTESLGETVAPTAFTQPEPTNPNPTTPTTPMPTQSTTGVYVQMVPTCMGFYTENNMSVDSASVVYCCLYDSIGSLAGDMNLYSSEHIAEEFPTEKGYSILSYDPTEKGLRLKAGRYRFCFYLDDGRVIFEGNITVS